MKNAINYYYNIYINDLVKSNDDYHFYFDSNEYRLIIFNRPYDDIKPIYNLNIEMLKRGISVHSIILNKQNQIITMINNKPYILLKLSNNNRSKVNLNDIRYIQNGTYNIKYDKELIRFHWIQMWSDKIDYYEYQISQLGKKYPILCDSLSYYIGLGENAISYLSNSMKKINVDSKIVVSHKRVIINKGSYDFYNPINYVIDSRIRDLCEYIKNSFFNDELNMQEIKTFISNSYLTNYEYILLFSRLLFPTYYFDIYDEIINNNLDEKIIIKIIDKNREYEKFLNDIYYFIVKEKNIFIEPIEWLIQRY